MSVERWARVGYTEAAIEDVRDEIERVDAARGDDIATPFGTGADWWHAAEMAKAECERAEARGEASFALALQEEVYEALAESDPDRLRTELVQVAAMALRWIRAIDARR